MLAIPCAWAASATRACSPPTDFLRDKFQPCMLTRFTTPSAERFPRSSRSCQPAPARCRSARDHGMALAERESREEPATSYQNRPWSDRGEKPDAGTARRNRRRGNGDQSWPVRSPGSPGGARHPPQRAASPPYGHTGVPSTEVPMRRTAMLWRLARRDWSPRMLEIPGVPASLFPPLSEAGAKVGEVTGAAAEVTGLPAGLPVATGGHDCE